MHKYAVKYYKQYKEIDYGWQINEILLEDSENVERRIKCRLALNNFDCYKELLSERKHKTKQSNLKDYFKKWI